MTEKLVAGAQPAAPPMIDYKDYPVAYSSAGPERKLFGIINYYQALEGVAWIYYVLFAVIIAFSEIGGFGRLHIVRWYILKALYPVSWMLVIFFLGPPPYKLKILQSRRHNAHLIFTLITSLGCIASGIAFIIVSSIYVASDECKNDSSSLCNKSGRPAFVFLVFMCIGLIFTEVLVIVTTAISFMEKRKDD